MSEEGKTQELIKKAELVMELRDYQKEELIEDPESIDITALETDSKDKVLVRVVLDSPLKSGAIGVEQVRQMKEDLSGSGAEKGILFGRRFTSEAKKALDEEGIEFFSRKKQALPWMSPNELYLRIRSSVDQLCQIKCGRIPNSEEECQGFSKDPVQCSFCDGSGMLNRLRCPICGGRGFRTNAYTCRVRLLSDNVDLHLEKNWVFLLRNDLLTLLEMLRYHRRPIEDSLEMSLKSPPQTSENV